MTEIKLKYFDTVPVCSSLCVLKTGFLFCAVEFGNQLVYFLITLSNLTPHVILKQLVLALALLIQSPESINLHASRVALEVGLLVICIHFVYK